jgi:hypothetical protein
MNIGLIVVVSLSFPLLWLSVCTDRRSYDEAIKLREAITESGYYTQAFKENVPRIKAETDSKGNPYRVNVQDPG